jgi:alkylation response protein AidB-like acyl-CoA dehydrogenase
VKDAVGGSDPLPQWALAPARSTDDPVGAAREVGKVAELGAAESDRLGRMCDDTARALCASGLLGLLLPRELGGIEAHPLTYIDVIEQLSYADGSVGWVTMATNFAIAGATSWYGDELVDAMLSPDTSFAAAAHIAPNGRAERVDGGYRIQGQFHFGSGSQIAGWLMGAFPLHDGDEPVRTETGAPSLVYAFAPREKVFIDPTTWDVAGMRATASYDYRILEQVVPDDYVMVPPGVRRRGGPALDLGVSMGHVSCSLGVAMRILDELEDLARSKQRLGRVTLIDQPKFQYDLGMHRGALAAARASTRSAFSDWYAEAEANFTASLETRARARLAACWGTKIASDIAEFAYVAAGTNALRNDAGNRIQRCFLDIEATAVHRHVEDNVLLETVQVHLGINDPALYLI